VTCRFIQNLAFQMAVPDQMHSVPMKGWHRLGASSLHQVAAKRAMVSTGTCYAPPGVFLILPAFRWSGQSVPHRSAFGMVPKEVF
jgi:hypothetical protein